MINKVIVAGRIINDIEVKRILKPVTNEKQRKSSAIVDGKRVALVTNFTVGVTIAGRKDFIRCAAFGTTAFNLERFAKKGMGIEIEGNLKSAVTNIGGKKIHTQDVWVEKFTFPPNNEKFLEPSVPEELPPMAYENTENEPEPENTQNYYEYYEDEADANNALPPEM